MTTTADYSEGNMVTIRCPSCGKMKLRVSPDDIDSGAADSMTCFDCEYEEIKEMSGFNPVRYSEGVIMTATSEYHEGNMVTIRCPSCGKMKLRVSPDDIDSGAADSMTCFDCEYEEIKEMSGFNPVRYMDYIEDARLPREFEGE